MMYAITEDGTRIEAGPDLQAFCPGCHQPVIAKCGKIYVNHWAHKSGSECDPWHEPETPWHTGWKKQFNPDCREKVIGEHRADIFALNRYSSLPCVIELQHSPIDFAEIEERENFYGEMVWVIDGVGFKDNFEFGREIMTNGSATVEAPFRWKWFRKSWAGSKKPLYLDFGNYLWRITSMDAEGRGKAQSWTYHEFLSQFSESIGENLPIHWRKTGSGSLIYRFGQGHVLIFEKPDGFHLAVLRANANPKMNYRPGTYKTVELAKARCEPHMAKLMKGN
ncbi:MAG TPA: competence protein CoiA family protein [Candidatus Limnocylindrales bacterium]|nr:competence protein CoiA family protein [Candidatus Limnocylindrales bacterium]